MLQLKFRGTSKEEEMHGFQLDFLRHMTIHISIIILSAMPMFYNITILADKTRTIKVKICWHNTRALLSLMTSPGYHFTGQNVLQDKATQVCRVPFDLIRCQCRHLV